MKAETRVAKYIKALCEGREAAVWDIMSKPRRRYARYLVERYGYTTHMALQVAYIHGFDEWPYDYRSHSCAREGRAAKSFGF